MPRLPRAVYWALVVGGLLASLHWVDRLDTPAIYKDDFVQDYLLARAILDGRDPYAVAGVELAGRYLPESAAYTIRHVSLHPPAAALLSVPFGLVSYRTARALWLGLEVALVVVLARLLPDGAESRRFSVRVAVPIMLLAWPPIAMDLQCGQWSVFLAALLALAWDASRAGRPGLAGSLLGLAIAIKAFPALLLPFFVRRREWRAVGSALAVGVVLSAAPIALVGPGLVTGYFGSGAHTTTTWLACFANYSALGAVARFVTSAGEFGGLPPVFSAPALTTPVVTATAVLVLVLSLRAVFSWRDPDAAFAGALCALVLLTPLVWQHYLTLLLWPLWLVGRRLASAGWPRPLSHAFFVAATLVTFPQQAVSLIAIAASQAWSPAGSLILLALPAGPIVLFCVLGASANGSLAAADVALSPLPAAGAGRSAARPFAS